MACCALAWLALSLLHASEAEVFLPDTQAPAFKAIVSRYTTALAAEQAQYTTAMSRHIKKYIDEAEEMLQEKKKNRNTTGIAIASTSKDIFETALSNLTATGTFTVPTKVRRELEATMGEFNTGRALLDNSLAAKKSTLFKQYSSEFSALILVLSPDLKGPDARNKMDERFSAMVEEKMPPPTPSPVPMPATDGTPSVTPNPTPTKTTDNTPGATVPPSPEWMAPPATSESANSPVLAESGQAASWITAGTFTASIYHMEIFDLSLREMHQGTNIVNQFSPITGATSKACYYASQTNIMNPGMVYRLKRIPNHIGVTVAEWPKQSNDFLLTVRSTRPEKSPSLVGFELQVAIPGKDASSTMNRTSSRPSASRHIALTIKSTPPHATVMIDGALAPDKFTPCTIPVTVGPHSVRLTLPGYKDLVVTNFVFTVDRQVNWTFKPNTPRR